jgi:hypothetical protein
LLYLTLTHQFTLESDACDTRIGAVLMQQGKPVAYLSKALSKQHQQLSIYEKEFLALIMVVEKWRSYLQKGGSLFKLITKAWHVWEINTSNLICRKRS